MYSKETGDRATLMLETESAISRCLILVCVGVFLGGGCGNYMGIKSLNYFYLIYLVFIPLLVKNNIKLRTVKKDKLILDISR